MNKPITGIVIPIIRKKYILNLVNNINDIINNNRYVVCVVNDGNNKINDYLKKQLPKKIHLINSENNMCFSGANNKGWKFLINKYPSIQYLGTINDDTVPEKNWLKELEKTLIDNANVGACSPVMITYEGFFKKKKKYTSTYKLCNIKKPMIIDKREIKNDTYVSILPGFCLLARSNVLKEINFFDENYKNSCEDLDISLKIRNINYDLMTTAYSYVLHHVGQSRFHSKVSTNIKESRQLLIQKWGENLSKHNISSNIEQG